MGLTLGAGGKPMVSRRALSLDHPLESQIIMLSYRGNSQFMDFDNPNMLDSIIPSIANQYIELYDFFSCRQLAALVS
jgi:hypothetical protein